MNDAVVKSLMKATTLSTAYRIGYEFLNNVGIGEHYVIFESQFRKPSTNFQNAAHLDNEMKNVDSHFTNLALKVIKNQVMPYLNFARSFSQKWKERLEADFVSLDSNTVFPFDDIQKKTSQLMEQFEGVRGDLENNELYSNVEASFIQLLKRCESLGETIENNVGDIYDFLNRRGQLKTSLSEQFVNQNNNTLEGFINKKQMGENIVGTLEMSKAQQFQKVVFFSDTSMAMLKSDNQWFAPDYRSKEYKHYGHEVINQYMDYFFRKKPKYKELFQNAITDNSYQLNTVLTLSNNVLTNERILKNNDANFFEQIKSKMKEKEFEELNDYIDDVVHTHNIEKLAESIMSNKYSHLYDANSFMYFAHLYDINISTSDLENNIGKKMARFENSQEFNQALKQYCDSLNNFDKDNYLKRMNNIDINMIDGADDEQKNYLVVKINDFEASEKLGTASWCISAYESYFEEYTSNNCKQYFVFDFSKEAYDKESMLGITLSQTGKVMASHYKDDTPIRETELEDKWKELILKNDSFAPAITPRKNKPTT